MMIRLYIISILLLFLNSCNSAGDYLKKADAAIEKKDFREAISFLDKAIAKKRYLTQAYIDKGYCYAELNNDDSAILAYSQVLCYLPDNTMALYNIGWRKYSQKKHKDAIDYFNRAMLSKGYNPDDTAKIRMIMELSPAWNEIQGNKFDIPFSEIFYAAGIAHYDAGQLRKAYDYFNSCISRQYSVGECYYMIGYIWLTSKENEKACEAFKNASTNGYAEVAKEIEQYCK
jgi:tetratricopeptide (TPR) repeat protein